MRFMKKKIALMIANLILIQSCLAAPVTIGIIEPLEHKAMDEIVDGFSKTLHEQYHQPVIIKIENAQNDANLQRAIIQKLRDAKYTMIVPIGVGATQMTLAMVHQQNVISLASDLSEQDRKKLAHCQVAVVHDEISSQQLLSFIHAAYPKITELTLIHSSADKVFPEVKETIAAGKMLGINIHPIMVSSLPELYTATQSLPSNAQGIFILKDSLIVSGISTLAKTAEKHHIPLITSDEGSVENGAALALGVHEREIGVQGAKLAAAVLQGKSACDLPVVSMNNLTVFMNKQAMQQEGVNIKNIIDAANKSNYQVEVVNQNKA